MLFGTFVERLAGWTEEEFLDRFPHPFLVEITDDALSRRIYRVNNAHGEKMIVGRGPRCHVRIIEKSISTTHTLLISPSGANPKWHVSDMDSSNGTYLNRTPILGQSTPIEIGDVIGFGPFTRFEFIDAPILLKRLPPLESITRPERSDSLSASSTHVDFDPTTVTEAHTGGLLLICDTLEPIALKVGQSVIVGRGDRTDLRLHDNRVSRRHAEFERREDGVYVRDLGSANGTLVGGAKLGEAWRLLPTGKTVMIGEWELYTGSPQSSTQIVQLPPD